MYNMTTVTVRELRHNFTAVEKTARNSPVRVTRRGKVIGTFSAKPPKSPKWQMPDFTARSRRILGDKLAAIDVRDFIG
ncbi:hypothetical protein OpiT1DRAFT_04151 [Opitutaceae bacterium TAV1]|nr:hypothetical protein OpiT1DRAFT_04151 [Opitutaceae bacterium TAV1]